MTTDTPNLVPLIAKLRAGTESPLGNKLIELLVSASESPKRGSIKRFLGNLDGELVDTVQFDLMADGTPASYWHAGARGVDTRATGAHLGESYREYAGVKSLYHSDSAYVGYTAHSSGRFQLIVYIAAEGN